MKQRNSAILSYGRTIRKATANDVSLIMDFIRQEGKDDSCRQR